MSSIDRMASGMHRRLATHRLKRPLASSTSCAVASEISVPARASAEALVRPDHINSPAGSQGTQQDLHFALERSPPQPHVCFRRCRLHCLPPPPGQVKLGRHDAPAVTAQVQGAHNLGAGGGILLAKQGLEGRHIVEQDDGGAEADDAVSFVAVGEEDGVRGRGQAAMPTLVEKPHMADAGVPRTRYIRQVWPAGGSKRHLQAYLQDNNE
ncbi:hypothetical protein PoMZ_03288 [Pyricularia oryzae]|uniref:Uncharacterized protein n=1 Tax=Pyricularia oryzae TaxID=318829 RepID=A0A4P7N6R3_PYROR|nr:hypothetical protein PoMZ_03288 [Pyricularia oryzae]